MYSTVWCGYCIRLKRQMERAGIAYVDVDIEADPAGAELVQRVNGGTRTVPTVLLPDGTALANPTFAEITDLMRQIA